MASYSPLSLSTVSTEAFIEGDFHDTSVQGYACNTQPNKKKKSKKKKITAVNNVVRHTQCSWNVHSYLHTVVDTKIIFSSKV